MTAERAADRGGGNAGAARTSQPSPEALIAELGGHPARLLGLVPGEQDPSEATLQRWLLACHLSSALRDERAARAVLRELDLRDRDRTHRLAAAAPAEIAAVLAGAAVPADPTPTRWLAAAAALVRVARGLAASAEPLRAAAAQADELESLAGAIARLGPGLGAATLRRFLEPLRDTWSAAAELPLDRAAVAAGVHLGWLGEGDEDAAALRMVWRRCQASCARDPEPGALSDLEAALARLGRAACVRERVSRCPLGPRCPRSESA